MIKEEVIKSFNFYRQSFNNSDGLDIMIDLLNDVNYIPALWTHRGSGVDIDNINIDEARATHKNDRKTFERFREILGHANNEFGPYEAYFRFDDMGENASGGIWNSFFIAGISSGRRNYSISFAPDSGSLSFDWDSSKRKLKYRIYPFAEIYDENMSKGCNIIPPHMSDDIIDKLMGPRRVRKERSGSLPHYRFMFKD